MGDVWQINPAAAGFGRAAGPDMFLNVTASDATVTISSYENSGG